VSTVVNWGTITGWVVAALLYAGRLLRGEAMIPPWLSRILSSNLIIGVVIGLGLLGSAGSLYLNYAQNHERLLEDVTISAYPQGAAQQTLQVISGLTFENENIPLDGHVYDRCTFINVCLLYDGGAYELQHATFKDHWKICVKEPPLKNYSALSFALHLMRPKTAYAQKSVLR
jgi:hypothetical protein